DFWGPLTDVIRRVSSDGQRLTIPPEAFDLVHLTDDVEEAVDVVCRTRGGGMFDEPIAALGDRIALELIDGLHFLEQLPASVTVLGGSRLEESDPAIKGVELIAEHLARAGVPTRSGGPGPISIALARGGHRGHRLLPQQAFGMRREDHRNLYGADRVHLVNDRLTHKVLLTENSRAFLALPGGLGTLDELFSVLCQLQTRKIPHRRLVLYGKAWWTPLFEAVEELMLRGPRKTISEADLQLVTITDDPEEAARLLLTPVTTPT
ncbi:MAG: LOG family protein, partial [Myxococcaceae bacterium]